MATCCPPTHLYEHSICIFEMPGKENAPVYPYVVEETTRRAKPYMFHTRQIKDYDFSIAVLLLSGKIHYIFDSGADFVLEAGETLLIPPKIPHSFESFSTGGSYCKLVVEFKGFALPELFLRHNISDYKLTRAGFSEFKARIIALRERANAPEERERLMAIGSAMELLYLMLNYSDLAWQASDLIFRARTELEKPDFRPVSGIAEQLGVSRSWLDREFSKAFGVSPINYRRKCKLERAQIMLTGTDMTIKEIADRLGYCNQFHFTNEFKRWYGVSPRELRRIPERD